MKDISKESITARLKKNNLVKKETITTVSQFWAALLSESGYESHFSLTKQERGMCKNLIKQLAGSGITARQFLEFAVNNWPTLREKLCWSKGKSRLEENPTFQQVYFAKMDISILMKKGIDEKDKITGKPKVHKKIVTYTKGNLPAKSHPQYESIKRMVEISGKVTVNI
jgi:hypothetical protein